MTFPEIRIWTYHYDKPLFNFNQHTTIQILRSSSKLKNFGENNNFRLMGFPMSDLTWSSLVLNLKVAFDLLTFSNFWTWDNSISRQLRHIHCHGLSIHRGIIIPSLLAFWLVISGSSRHVAKFFDDEISGCWPNDPESIPLLEFDVDPFKLLQKQPIALKIDSSTNQSCFTQLQLFYTTLISNI